MMNMRRVLEPFTAKNLRVKRNNVVRDFASIASIFNVTHLLIFTKTVKACYLRIARLPRGPTLTYKIRDYSLVKDVVANMRKPEINSLMFMNSPLVVLNGFTKGEPSDEMQLKLSTSMWRNMFPSINVNKVNLNNIRRAVMLNYNPETKFIDFRHYAIKVKPVGLSKPVRKLLSKKLPDLGRFKNFEEMFDQDGFTSGESEGEMDDKDETRQVVLSQKMKAKGSMLNEKSAIRLVEIGPRMTLELLKVEEGLMSGNILYHSIIKLTKAQIQERRKAREDKLRLKKERRETQEANVKRKATAKEEQRRRDQERVGKIKPKDAKSKGTS